MSSSFSRNLFFFSFFLPFFTETATVPTIGVTYTTLPGSSTTSTSTTSQTPSDPSYPPPEHVPSLIRSIKMTSVRLPESDPLVVRAFLYSNVSIHLTIPNSFLPAIATNRSDALRWLYRHVIPFYPRSRITSISVGDDILQSSPDLSDYLLPAIRNIQVSLRQLGIRGISVSTTFTFINIMTTAFPPSAAEFQEPVSELLIKPLLQFLEDTNSSFLINMYPYNLYRLTSEIPIGFALFQEQPFNFRDDITTGVRYRNLFDMMVDSVICAMAVAGHENIPVIVTETGWPSSGEAIEVDANPVYAEMYLNGLLTHLKSGIGTPLRKEGVAETYIYELFDRSTKQGRESERKWGMFYPNMTKKYPNINFSGSAKIAASGKIAGMLVLAVYVLIFLRV